MEKSRNEKGHLLPGHGGLKPKGAVSEKTKMWNELGEWFVQAGAAKCMRIMNEMEDEEYIKHYTALLEYFKPKQARITHSGDEKAPVVIQVHSDL
jgi:DNA-binding Lrp family transcriptional regulator